MRKFGFGFMSGGLVAAILYPDTAQMSVAFLLFGLAMIIADGFDQMVRAVNRQTNLLDTDEV